MAIEQQTTNNIKVPNKDLEVLKKHFSQCFDKDGNFQIDKFSKRITEKEINFSSESYGMEWLGKSYARLLASDPATTLLTENESFNALSENQNSENLLIKGDNLEVLKHLANAYFEKIKMIYIDPPYNTGSDGFVYQDDRKFSARELQNLAGIDIERANRILDFTKSNSNSHSAWLTFMYPRLYIAKQLLKDDGVIFISIDDNEVAQLRLMMDEIFGEENFVGEFIRQSKIGGGSDSRHIVKEHEYVICYSKNFNLLDDFFIDFTFDYLKRYKEEDEKGKYFWDTLARPGLTSPIFYEIEAPDGTLIKDGWIRSKTRFEDDYKNGEIKIFKKNDGKWAVHFKQRLNESGKKPRSFTSNFGGNIEGKKDIVKIFENDKIFSYPKPIGLINQLLKFCNTQNEIILDFFAGSGTTADAVMQLNAEDGGKRKFILVQIPEPIDAKKNKVAFDFVKNELHAEPSIFEITKERLLRAAKKVNENSAITIIQKEKEIVAIDGKLALDDKKTTVKQLKTDIENLKKQDLGFKIFETMPIWDDYDFEAEDFNNQTQLFDDSKLTDSDVKALLTTWKTFDGIALTSNLQNIDLDGYIAQYGSQKLYLMNKGFVTDNLILMLEKIDGDKNFNPTTIIAFGFHFESKNMREIAENIKSYANKKNIDIDFIIRY